MVRENVFWMFYFFCGPEASLVTIGAFTPDHSNLQSKSFAPPRHRDTKKTIHVESYLRLSAYICV